MSVRSMQKALLIMLTFMLSVMAVYAENQKEQGLHIATEIDRANSGFVSDDATIELKMISENGDEVKRLFTIQTQEFDGDGDRSLITFSWPADVKGTRMLTWAHLVGDDDQWLFLPALQRVKRIATNNKSSSFMGSEFSYEDMSTAELSKYSYKFLQDVRHNDRDCWKIERISTSSNSGYSKEIVFYDKAMMNSLRIEYYDRRGDLLKIATLQDYKQYEQWWRPGVIRMENIKTRKTSVITWTSYKLSERKPDVYFTRENLDH